MTKLYCNLTAFIGNIEKSQRRNKIRLNSSTGDVKEAFFADAVRGGNERRVAATLQMNWPNIEPILMSQLSFDLTLDRDTSLDSGQPSRRSSVTGIDLGDGGVPDIDKVTMTVTPFHLAIIAKQAGIVRVFMEKVMDIAEEDNKRLDLLVKLLGAKTLLLFPKNPLCYDKDDRSLDGMNAFHLGAKYSAAALQEIFYYLNDRDSTAENETKELETEIKELLEAKDEHLQQTPLHVAATHPSSIAAR